MIAWIQLWTLPISYANAETSSNFSLYTNTMKEKSRISLPPQDLCPPAIDIPHLSRQYNLLNYNIHLLSNLDFSNTETAILTNTTESDSSQVIFLVSSDTMELAKTTCNGQGTLYKIAKSSLTRLFNILRRHISKTGISVAIEVTVGSNDKPVTSDGKTLSLRDQVFDKTFPYIIFDAESMNYATEKNLGTTVLCVKTDSPLTNDLSQLRSAISTHVIALETSRGLLKHKLNTILPPYTNYTIKFETNNTLNVYTLGERQENCLVNLLQLTRSLNNMTYPTIVTPRNMETSSTLLEDRILEVSRFLTSALQNLDSLRNDRNLPELTYSYKYRTYQDLFDLLPGSSRTKELLILLLALLTSTTALFLLFISCIYMLIRRGSSSLIRSAEANVNIQMMPYPPSYTSNNENRQALLS